MKNQSFVIGDGGFARELKAWLEYDSYMIGELISPANEVKFIEDCKRYYQETAERVPIYLGVGSPSLKKKLYEKYDKYEFFYFPSFVSEKAITVEWPTDAEGLIICPGVIITTNVKFGKCVTVNINTCIGHDCDIGDFASIMPKVAISGNVKIGEYSYLGVGCSILENINIGNSVVVGAQSLVNKNVESNKTVVGVPAKDMIRNK